MRMMALSVSASICLAATVPDGASLPVAPSGAEAYRHVVTYGAEPLLHRTGTPGDAATAAWIAEEFRSAGLRTVAEDFTFTRFAPRRVSLTVGDFRPVAFPLYYSGMTGPEGVVGRLVDVSVGTPLDFERVDVAGSVAVIDVPAVQNAISPTLEGAISAARDGGAIAIVLSVRAALNEAAAYNMEARGGLCGIPIVIVGKIDGATLRARDGMTARLVLDAALEDGSDGAPIGHTRNVVATIPGQSDDTIIIGTPFTGWFGAAAERGPGIGVLLTLAKHFAAQAEHDPPPLTIVFVATAGHEVGLLGLDEFVRANPDVVDRTAAYLHLGAGLATRNFEEVAGEVIELPTPEEIRLAWASENEALQPIVQRAFATNLLPIPTVPPAALNPGEQRVMYRHGIPMMALASSHLWIHTAGDEAFITSPELLEPVVQAYRQITEELLELDTATLRSSNGLAAAFAPTSDDSGVAAQNCG